MATAAGGVFGLCALNHSASFFFPLCIFPVFKTKRACWILAGFAGGLRLEGLDV